MCNIKYFYIDSDTQLNKTKMSFPLQQWLFEYATMLLVLYMYFDSLFHIFDILPILCANFDETI